MSDAYPLTAPEPCGVKVDCPYCDGSGHRCDQCDGDGFLLAEDMPERPNEPRMEIFDAYR